MALPHLADSASFRFTRSQVHATVWNGDFTLRDLDNQDGGQGYVVCLWAIWVFARMNVALYESGNIETSGLPASLPCAAVTSWRDSKRKAAFRLMLTFP
jgi:hypothetical protein